jgi:hypothetical protein
MKTEASAPTANLRHALTKGTMSNLRDLKRLSVDAGGNNSPSWNRNSKLSFNG